MSLFNKKEKPTEQPSLPNLPDLPKIEGLGDSKFQDTAPITSNLPELPSQASTNPPSKDPIGQPALPNKPPKSYESLPHPPRSRPNFPLTKEVSSGKEEVKQGRPRTLELSGSVPQDSIMRELPAIPKATRASKNEPVFVRIDKYQAAVQAFNEIKSQLTEIEEYLKEVRELKQQEESELASWEEEIETIKSRLNNIDQGVFGKLS